MNWRRSRNRPAFQIRKISATKSSISCCGHGPITPEKIQPGPVTKSCAPSSRKKCFRIRKNYYRSFLSMQKRVRTTPRDRPGGAHRDGERCKHDTCHTGALRVPSGEPRRPQRERRKLSIPPRNSSARVRAGSRPKALRSARFRRAIQRIGTRCSREKEAAAQFFQRAVAIRLQQRSSRK